VAPDMPDPIIEPLESVAVPAQVPVMLAVDLGQPPIARERTRCAPTNGS
jgi:hypothetical protein